MVAEATAESNTMIAFMSVWLELSKSAFGTMPMLTVFTVAHAWV